MGKKIPRAGVGVDIGTTTVNAELVDLDTGTSLETVSVLNDQHVFGADVMSRIGAARYGKAAELFTAINQQIEGILQQFIKKWGIGRIEQCTVSGNTVMLHFFAGVDPSSMGEAPYTPVFLEERHFKGGDIFLSADNVTLLPCISSFVGADIVSGIAFLDILKSNNSALFVDLGTNGEIAAWKKSEKRLLCCSTAAGPCFEGVDISCGVGAIPGAINRISMKKDPEDAGWNKFGSLYYTVLGSANIRGICGSGIIDAMAVMKQLDVFDESGAMRPEYVDDFPVTLEIAITQKDVRVFQLAKSAIYSGIMVLCRTMGIKPENMEAAYIAGGLGFFINLESAVCIGLLPGDLSNNRVNVCGNTSLKGAVKSLIDPSFLPRCREIASLGVTVDLAVDRDFTELFASNMGF